MKQEDYYQFKKREARGLVLISVASIVLFVIAAVAYHYVYA